MTLENVIQEEAHSKLLKGPQGWKIIELKGRNILDEAMVHYVGEELKAYINQDSSGSDKYVIDLGNVDHMSSAMLSKMMAINESYRETRNENLSLVQMDPRIREVFAITQMTEHFQMYDTIGNLPQ